MLSSFSSPSRTVIRKKLAAPLSPFLPLFYSKSVESPFFFLREIDSLRSKEIEDFPSPSFLSVDRPVRKTTLSSSPSPCRATDGAGLSHLPFPAIRISPFFLSFFFQTFNLIPFSPLLNCPLCCFQISAPTAFSSFPLFFPPFRTCRPFFFSPFSVGKEQRVSPFLSPPP